MSNAAGGERPATEALAPLPSPPSASPTADETALLPRGFRVAGVRAGIKASKSLDLGLVIANGAPLPVALTTTTNRLPAAPVRMNRAHLLQTSGGASDAEGEVSAMMVTSGCANAATGAAGEADQLRLATSLANAVGTDVERVLAMSTGLIGTRLPVPVSEAAMSSAINDELSTDDAAWLRVAEAMRTTDSRAKVASVRFSLPDTAGETTEVIISGVAKGVGMIHPNMATMLSFVLTDATANPALLSRLLRPIVARTWNQISVDGDQSTNDTVMLVASGAAGAVPLDTDAAAQAKFATALQSVARSLARQQARDGEGATTLITCVVSGARDDADARAVAREVVSSSLLKAAVHGADPNWGRMIAAIGNAALPAAAVLEAAGLSAADARVRGGAAAEIDESRLRIDVCGVPVFAGAPLDFDEADASTRMKTDEIILGIDLRMGEGMGEAFGCDLTEAYVIENSEYST